ncbi:exodeoxyribonuclease III [Synergistales bacterium]|nr:exodeoxyribonuclease III [Synergistales bacterium]
MRIATFNVNSVRSRLTILERWLSKLDKPVDVLFLQETKAVDADFPEDAIDELGYKSYFRGEKSYNGVAALVRKDAKIDGVSASFGFGDGEEPDFLTRALYLKTPSFSVLNTYVPQGKDITHADYDVKKRFLARARAFFERAVKPGFPFVWLGDMNVAQTEIDVTHPENKKNHVCFHSEIRESFARVADFGLTDIMRKFHPEEGVYTFFDYRVKDAVARGIGWRIDLMMANEAASDAATDCFVDTEPRLWDRPSDHTPLVADFALS